MTTAGENPSRGRGGILRSGVSRILIGSLVGQGVLLAASPLLTRLYRPEDFAALTAFTALATVLGGIVTLSWERAVVIPRAEQQVLALLLLGIGTVLVVGLISALVSFFIGPSLDELFETAVFAPFWWLLPATIVVMGAYSLFSAWIVRNQLFGKLAGRNIVLGVSQAVSSVLLGIAGVGPVGLVSGMAVGRASALFGMAPWRALSSVRRPSRRRIVVVARRYRRFPLVATWSRVLNILGLQLPPLLIVAIYGSVEAGLYALTVRVLAAPIGMVVDAVSQYFEGTFAQKVRSRSEHLSAFILTISARLFILGLVPGIIVAIFAPTVFAWLFGEQWRVAGTFAQIVVAFYVFQLAISPVSRALLILEQQATQLVWDVTRAMATAAAVALPAVIGGSLETALILLAATQVVFYLALLVLCVRAARREEAASRGYLT